MTTIVIPKKEVNESSKLSVKELEESFKINEVQPIEGPNVIWNIPNMKKLVEEKGLEKATRIISSDMFDKDHVKERLLEFSKFTDTLCQK